MDFALYPSHASREFGCRLLYRRLSPYHSRSSFKRTRRLASTSAASAAACAFSSRVSESGILWTSKLGARRCYGGSKTPPTPGLKVCGFGHGERRRKLGKKVTIVLAFGHALRAHEALSRPDALPGFFEVVHRLFEDTFVGHDPSIRTSGSLRSPDCVAFSRECADCVLLRKRRRSKAAC
jgi:hypothetical protein